MSRLVSILIPAYNAAAWLDDAVNSALAQTWKEREVIIIDDGSKDQTLAVARRFEGPKVKVVTQPNQGASATRNRALAQAQGDYIQWLDADDVIDPDKISRQLVTLDGDDTILLSSAWSRYYYRPNKAVFRHNELCRDHTPVGWLQTKMETNAWMAIECWLVSRRLAEKAGPWDTSLTADDDGDYFARVVAASSAVRYVPESRSRCRLANPHSLSKGMRSPRWLASQLQSVKKQIACMRSLEDGDRSRRAACAVLQRWYAHFYPSHPNLMREAEALVAALGGTLRPPIMSWRYRWLQAFVGIDGTKAVQASARNMRARLACEWDHLLYRAGL